MSVGGSSALQAVSGLACAILVVGHVIRWSLSGVEGRGGPERPYSGFMFVLANTTDDHAAGRSVVERRVATGSRRAADKRSGGRSAQSGTAVE